LLVENALELSDSERHHINLAFLVPSWLPHGSCSPLTREKTLRLKHSDGPPSTAPQGKPSERHRSELSLLFFAMCIDSGESVLPNVLGYSSTTPASTLEIAVSTEAHAVRYHLYIGDLGVKRPFVVMLTLQFTAATYTSPTWKISEEVGALVRSSCKTRRVKHRIPSG
jgi:hypothetical protein